MPVFKGRRPPPPFLPGRYEIHPGNHFVALIPGRLLLAPKARWDSNTGIPTARVRQLSLSSQVQYPSGTFL